MLIGKTSVVTASCPRPIVEGLTVPFLSLTCWGNCRPPLRWYCDIVEMILWHLWGDTVTSFRSYCDISEMILWHRWHDAVTLLRWYCGIVAMILWHCWDDTVTSFRWHCDIVEIILWHRWDDTVASFRWFNCNERCLMLSGSSINHRDWNYQLWIVFTSFQCQKVWQALTIGRSYYYKRRAYISFNSLTVTSH